MSRWKIKRAGGRTRRMWYAEDISAAMEMLNEGCEPWAVAIAYGTTIDRLQHVLALARKQGLDGFPMRERERPPLRLLKPPAVSGEDSRRFLQQFVMTA